MSLCHFYTFYFDTQTFDSSHKVIQRDYPVIAGALKVESNCVFLHCVHITAYLIQLKGPVISRCHYPMLYVKLKSQNGFLLKWFWQKVRACAANAIFTGQRMWKNSIVKESTRDVVREKMTSWVEEGEQGSMHVEESSHNVVATTSFHSAACCLTVDHLCNGKSSLLYPPETHKLGIIPNFAYFSRHMAWYALQKLTPMMSHFGVTRGILTTKITKYYV